MTIRIGIVGYGNIGRGVENAVAQNPDLQVVAIFTRRAPAALIPLTRGVKVVPLAEVEAWKGARLTE